VIFEKGDIVCHHLCIQKPATAESGNGIMIGTIGVFIGVVAEDANVLKHVVRIPTLKVPCEAHYCGLVKMENFDETINGRKLTISDKRMVRNDELDLYQECLEKLGIDESDNLLSLEDKPVQPLGIFFKSGAGNGTFMKTSR